VVESSLTRVNCKKIKLVGGEKTEYLRSRTAFEKAGDHRLRWWRIDITIKREAFTET
jgi:hypothetical protein